MFLPLLNFIIKKIKKNETINNDKTSTSFTSLNFPFLYAHRYNTEQINKITYCLLKFIFDLKYFIYFCSFTNTKPHM